MIPEESEIEVLPYSEKWYKSLELTLGDAACRQLGLYAIPVDFLLSVLIPIYN